MKAILIDSTAQEIREVDAKGLSDYYDLLDCDLVEVATYLPNGDCVYVDEEGLYTKEHWFDIGAHQPFVGNGIVIGSAKNGNTVDAKTSLEEIEELVTFLGRRPA